METLVQFADDFRMKFVRCENASSEELTIEAFVGALPANIQSAVRMSWRHDQGEKFLEIAMFAERLQEYTQQKSRLLMAPVQKSHF